MPALSMFAAVALAFGLLFFIFAARYYLFTATIFIMQFVASLRNGNGNGNGKRKSNGPSANGNGTGSLNLNGFEPSLQNGNGHANGNGKRNGKGNGNGSHTWRSEPFFSIHVATYNERNVIDRLIASCMSIDYSNYEVIIVDDSTDETVEKLEHWKQSTAQTQPFLAGGGGQMQQILLAMGLKTQPTLKIIHRDKRSGFKGAALNEAIKQMDQKAEYVVVLDADFVPAPDLIKQFLTYIRTPDTSTIFGEIIALDEAFSRGEMPLDKYLRKREQLTAKIAGRNAKSVGNSGMESLLKLERLYSENAVDLETYLRRRQFILDMLKNVGVDTLTRGPLSDRSSLIRTHELDQLFAENKIDVLEYARQRKPIASPQEDNKADDKAPQSDRVTVADIINLDHLYAQGRIADQEWYEKERACLVQKLRGEEEHERLQALFETDQTFAKGSIDVNDYAQRRLQLTGHENGNGNGLSNGNGKATIWHLRKTSGNDKSNGKSNGNGHTNGKNGLEDDKVAVIQGYQWHYLNKSESWLTQGIRAEYSGNYVVERTCQEIYGGMKMISGSVYAIRADVLRKYGWSTSITEDWELTCRLYKDGYKVQYTPTIQVPAEAPSTIRRLIRQRQRWAEGHTYNAKRYFIPTLKSRNLTLREKLEFLYFAPYYLQSLFMIAGSAFWMISEMTHQYLPFWTAVFGWSLLMSNLIALPLMNLAGLFAEGTVKRDFTGVLSTIILAYILAPFQAFAALKGLIEKHEGTWIRTFKTGRVTDPISKLKLGRFLLGARKKRTKHASSKLGRRFLWSPRRREITSTLCLLLITLSLAASLFGANGVHTVSAQELVDNKWSLDNNTGYVLGRNDGNYMTFRSYVSATSSTSYSKAVIGYRSNTGTVKLSAPHTRDWDGTAWSAETELATAGSPVRWVRTAYCPLSARYYEKIIVTLSDDYYLDAYVWTGSSYSATNNIGAITVAMATYRPFDIAYEKTSGRALLVYGVASTDTTKDLAYKIWDGSSWSAEYYIDATCRASGGDCMYQWVELASKPTAGSDEIALIAHEYVAGYQAISAWIWGGSSFGNNQQLEMNAADYQESIAVAYESQSGYAMFVWYDSASSQHQSRRWLGSSWEAERILTATSDSAFWVTLKSDPASNRIMFLMVTDAKTLYTADWNPTTWTVHTQHDNSIDYGTSRSADGDWEPTGSKYLMVYGRDSSKLRWKTWTTSGWSGTTDITATQTHQWVQLRRNPRNVAGDVKILGAMLNNDKDLGALKWDGTTLTNIGNSVFTADTNVVTYECFDLRLQIGDEPSEYTSEVEFTGSSDTQSWSQLVWTVDSAWTAASVTVTIQLYNYNTASYPGSGDGYLSYTSSGTANIDETKTQTITTNPTYFRDGSGNWKLKIKGVKATSTQFDFKADWVEYKPTKASGETMPYTPNLYTLVGPTTLVSTDKPNWNSMRDRYTPLAGTVTLTNAKFWMSDRTGADRYITSPIPGSTTWTVYLSWQSKATGAFTITFYVYTTQGETAQNQIVTGVISLPSGTGPSTIAVSVDQVSPVTPTQTPYDIVLILTPSGDPQLELNTGIGGSYLEYSGTIVPETLMPLFVAAPLLPFLASKHRRRRICRLSIHSLRKILSLVPTLQSGESDGI